MAGTVFKVSTPVFDIDASPESATAAATPELFPTKIFVEIKDDVNLELNKTQSVELMAPVVVEFAVAIDMTGVEDPVATEIGKVPVTVVTEPVAALIQLGALEALELKICPAVPTPMHRSAHVARRQAPARTHVPGRACQWLRLRAGHRHSPRD